MDRLGSGDMGVGRHMGQGEKRSVSTRMHQCGAKGVVGAQDICPSVGVASGRMVGVA